MPSSGGAPVAAGFYADALDVLIDSGVPFLVGGAYALACYTGIARDTKDLDVFVHPRQAGRVLEVFAAAGYRTELTFPHWLGKVYPGHEQESGGRGGRSESPMYPGDEVVDVIYSSGNGFAEVDDAWFAHAVPGAVLGRPVRLSPPEEMIWSKAFIMERERYDGADIAHVLRARGRDLDWTRLVRRFGAHWRVLLGHLVLFGFVYPGERDRIPTSVIRELLRRLEVEMSRPAPRGRVCAGTLLSRAQYLVDVERWGYEDVRRANGIMSDEAIATWTAAIEGEPPRAAA
jgi:hypothetical protein